ncbi:MAG: glutamate synthase-related protein [Nitrospinota bacterium]
MPSYKAANIDELKPGEKKCVTCGGLKLLLARLAEGYFAVQNRCPHRQGQLCDGRLDREKGEIACGLHGWNFDLRTGVSPYDPNDRLETYRVDELEDGIYINLPVKKEMPPLNDYLDPWRRRRDVLETDMEMIHHMADGWIGEKGYTEPMRPEKQEKLWNRIVFLPRQVSAFPIIDGEEVKLSTVIGKGAKKPLTISLPVYVSHMSFGALSREAKIALAKGSAMAGTMICSGEGGMMPEERENADTYIFEMASGYFGWNEENMNKADAIEIKMGQAAKAGKGGMLPAGKVTGEIAKVRGLEPGENAISPARFPDINSIADLRVRISEIRQTTGGKPVGIKFAASRIEEDLAAALECEPDFITIDGRGGATGAAPKHIKDSICVPTLFALDRARRFLEKQGVEIDLLVTGGFRLPSDFAKAIALGATAVASASAAMMAIGCQQYRACHTGRCPVGIATQDPYYRSRLDVEASAQKLANFFKTAAFQMADFARICGRKRIHDLSLSDIATTDGEIAKYTSIRHVGEGERLE